MKFEVGDRVRLTPEADEVTDVPAKVAWVISNGLYVISFERYPGFGWPGGDFQEGNIDDSEKFCWAVTYDEIEKIRPRQLELFGGQP